MSTRGSMLIAPTIPRASFAAAVNTSARRAGGTSRASGRDDRPAVATPAPRARALAARAVRARRLVRVHLPDRSGGAPSVGQGAADAGAEARSLSRLSRDRVRDQGE